MPEKKAVWPGQDILVGELPVRPAAVRACPSSRFAVSPVQAAGHERPRLQQGRLAYAWPEKQGIGPRQEIKWAKFEWRAISPLEESSAEEDSALVMRRCIVGDGFQLN